MAGTVRLSLSGTYQSVAWFVDTTAIGGGSTEEGNPTMWNTSKTPVGSHVLIAQVTLADGGSLEVRRAVEVGPTVVPFTMTGAVELYTGGTAGGRSLWVDPQSPNGSIVNVAAVLDGKPWGELTATNSVHWIDRVSVRPVYSFSLSSGVPPCSGDHTVAVTATDSAGNTKTASFAVPHNDLPAVTADSFVDVVATKPTLNVSGTACSDSTNPLRVTAKLGDLVFLNAGAGAFTGALDVSGMPAGDYLLTVQADAGAAGPYQAITTVMRTITLTGPAK